VNDQDGSVRDDYSGRGMYGDRCLSIVVDSESSAVRALVVLAQDSECASDAQDLAERWTVDQMGLGVVVYFPGANAPEGLLGGSSNGEDT
jgi:hypothetical protein